MSSEEPCDNEDCDLCYPIPRFKICIERVQRVFYEREVKAETAEEALKIVNEGTAWPSSYDDRYGEILEQHEPVVELLPSDDLEFVRKNICWHRLGKNTE